MPKKAVSVTLDAANLLWLKGRTVAGKGRSVSDTLNALISEVRESAPYHGEGRSVVGSIDLPADDPDLAGADQYIRSLFGQATKPHRG
ncbi:MAG TPA: hypothetical protein VFV78_14175 [Vicinamibacterales bacterium]|nr:hypothetical protein [Vicinamibacterales bacterium]